MRFRTLDLAVAFYHTTHKLSLPYHLKDQLQRASSSCALNLSEGSAKVSKRDRRRFYRIAFASHREAITVLRLAQQPTNGDLTKQADKLAAHLYRLCESRGLIALR